MNTKLCLNKAGTVWLASNERFLFFCFWPYFSHWFKVAQVEKGDVTYVFRNIWMSACCLFSFQGFKWKTNGDPFFRKCKGTIWNNNNNKCNSSFISSWVEITQTLKQESFVPVGVEVLPLDFCLQLVLLVWQQIDFDKGVGGAGEVLCRELLAPENFDGEGRVLEAVAYAELDPAQLLTDGPFAVVILRTRRQLGGHKCSQININTCSRSSSSSSSHSHEKFSPRAHTFSDTSTCTQTVTERSCEGRRFQSCISITAYSSSCSKAEIGLTLRRLREFYFLSNVLKRQEVLRLKIEEL